MNIEEIREYCLAKSGVTEGFPFDETTLVFKVMNKMFALTGLEGDPPFVNLKCDSERAIELRGHYIIPNFLNASTVLIPFSSALFTSCSPLAFSIAPSMASISISLGMIRTPSLSP